MKLKKLITAGFKSFADRMEFEFDDGISCIVGPNGCGKSNIVDAMKWVMGEQSAKSLRGGEMMDVIFSGSAGRRPSSQAYVTLVFDNRDGLLQPVADGEIPAGDTVSITRRLYRSAQSEYLINNTPCRLRDIRDMFLDTGIGTNAYSIIEQGRVSQFLQATQEQQRAFFDEAAGIGRYKARRKEALRKLDRVEQNLLRLADILGEVEKRLRSIKYQAGKARNYQTYSERLNELRSLFFLSRYHRMQQQRKARQGELDGGNDRLAGIQVRIGKLDSAQSAAEVEGVQLEQTARDVQSRIATIASQITALQERADQQTNRLEELGRQILNDSHRCEELEARIETCAKDLAARRVQQEQLDGEADRLQNECDELRQAIGEGELEIDRLAGQLEGEKTGVVELLHRTTQLHNDVHTIGLRRQNLHGEKLRVVAQADQLAEDIRQLLVEHAQENARIKDTDELINDSQDKLRHVRGASEELVGEEQKLSRELGESRERRSVLAGRIHTLQEMQDRMEGVSEGARRVLEACRAGRLGAIRGMLGDYMETDVEHARLVEAALSGADQRLLVAHFSELQAAAGELEQLLSAGGSIEVICLDRVAELRTDEATVSCPQSLGRVLDLVKFEPWLEPAMWRLLGHTLVVRTLGDAFEAAEVTPPGYRFLCLTGELLEADGRVRLGATNRPDGVIARRSELADLRRQQQQLEEAIERLARQSQHAHEQREHLDRQMHSLRTAVYEATFERGEGRKRLAGLDERIAEQKRREPLLALNLKDIEAQIDSAIRTEHETKEKAASLEQLKTDREAAVRTLEEQLSAARARREELGEKHGDLRAGLAAAEQKKLAQRDAADALRRQKDAMETELASARDEIALDRKRRLDAEAEIKNSREEVEKLYTAQQELQAEQEDTEQSRRGLNEQLAEIRAKLTERRGEAEQQARDVANLRVKLGELDAHIAELISRADDEMQMDLVEQFSQYEHDDQRNWDEVETEIDDLRAKISRLGNVNLDAIDEQEQLDQRREFLSGQLEDITSSRKQLEELIRKINKESRQRFIETFAAVRENFQVLFRKLFGGGKADIILVDPDDILESAIEIVARPPGKELRSISLLSGGEKTMAALAMIFSFFRAKPSPFCLLDEVDAALDEANNERYNLLVQEFVEDTQFIMISHAKRTMAMANVLYGVTMQEPGVSRQINVRFEQAQNLDEKLQPVGV